MEEIGRRERRKIEEEERGGKERFKREKEQ